MALSRDGRNIATASLDGTARVWPARVDDGRVLLGHTDAIGAVTALPVGGALSYGWDGEVRAWDSALGAGRTLCRGPQADKAPARSLVSIDDVGMATAFLAHDGARLITGETLYVDGGYHIMD